MRSILEIQMENQSQIETLPKNKDKIQLFQNEPSLKNDFNNIMNGFAVNYFFKRYLKTQFCQVFMLLINLATLHIYFELHLQKNQWKTSILIMQNIISLFTIFLIIIRYLAYREFKIQESLKRSANQGEVMLVILKLLVMCLQPYSFCENYKIYLQSGSSVQQYYLNDILFIFSLLRYGLILPIFLINSKYATPRSTRICKLYGCQSNYFYSLKSFFKDFSIQTMIFTFVFSSLLIASAYRAAQYNINHHLKDFQNAFWLTIITTLTVGYGQLYPITILGRLVGVFCIYWGVLIISVMIVVLTNTFQLNARQKKALTLIKILQNKQQIKQASAQYIRQSLWRVWKNYKNKRSYIYKNEGFKQRKLKEKLHKKRVFQKANFSQNSIKEQMQFNFNQITGYIQTLQQNNEKIINYLQEKQ